MPIDAKDLSQEPPRSPRALLGGYVLAARMLDKARAELCGTAGQYLFNCGLDRIFLAYKGITAKEVLTLLALGWTDEEVLKWIDSNGEPRTAEEIRAWAESLLEDKTHFFNHLETDDRALLTKRSSSSSHGSRTREERSVNGGACPR
jgi:hypothetical protein